MSKQDLDALARELRESLEKTTKWVENNITKMHGEVRGYETIKKGRQLLARTAPEQPKWVANPHLSNRDDKWEADPHLSETGVPITMLPGSESEKKYKSGDGESMNIYQMVRHEPGWVASRFKHMEKEIASLKEQVPGLVGCHEAASYKRGMDDADRDTQERLDEILRDNAARDAMLAEARGLIQKLHDWIYGSAEGEYHLEWYHTDEAEAFLAATEEEFAGKVVLEREHYNTYRHKLKFQERELARLRAEVESLRRELAAMRQAAKDWKTSYEKAIGGPTQTDEY